MSDKLHDLLEDWTDWDMAEYYLGRCLGLFKDKSFHVDVKHVFWTDNDLGNALHGMLLYLVTVGILERQDDPDEQFRWTRSDEVELYT